MLEFSDRDATPAVGGANHRGVHELQHRPLPERVRDDFGASALLEEEPLDSPQPGLGADVGDLSRPVRPGDELRIESEVLEVRPSRSRPEQGLIKVRTTTLNQNDEAVQVIIANLVVPRRPTQGGEETAATEHVDPAGERVPSKYRRTTAAAPTGDH